MFVKRIYKILNIRERRHPTEILRDTYPQYSRYKKCDFIGFCRSFVTGLNPSNFGFLTTLKREMFSLFIVSIVVTPFFFDSFNYPKF